MRPAAFFTARPGLGGEAGGHRAHGIVLYVADDSRIQSDGRGRPRNARGLGVSVYQACDSFSQASEGVSGALSALPAAGLSSHGHEKSRKSW